MCDSNLELIIELFNRNTESTENTLTEKTGEKEEKLLFYFNHRLTNYLCFCHHYVNKLICFTIAVKWPKTLIIEVQLLF